MKKCLKNVALVATMARSGYDGKTLAKETGLCQLSISKLINRKSLPTQRTATAIATALGCEPLQLGWEKFAYERRQKGGVK